MITRSPIRHSTSHRSIGSSAAFTLVEIMVASAIATVILGAIISSYILLARNFRDIVADTSLHGKARMGVDYFTRDMRAAYDVVSFNSSNLTVIIPVAYSSGGDLTSSNQVTYQLKNAALYRTDLRTGKALMVATNVVNAGFSLFNNTGDDISATAGNTSMVITNDADGVSTTNVTIDAYSEVKGVQMSFSLAGSVRKGVASENYSSAIVNMRSKDDSPPDPFDPFDPDV